MGMESSTHGPHAEQRTSRLEAGAEKSRQPVGLGHFQTGRLGAAVGIDGKNVSSGPTPCGERIDETARVGGRVGGRGPWSILIRPQAWPSHRFPA